MYSPQQAQGISYQWRDKNFELHMKTDNHIRITTADQTCMYHVLLMFHNSPVVYIHNAIQLSQYTAASIFDQVLL